MDWTNYGKYNIPSDAYYARFSCATNALNTSAGVYINTDTKIENYIPFEEINVVDYNIPIQKEMLKGDYIADTEYHTWNKIILTGDETISIGNYGTNSYILDKTDTNNDIDEICVICNYFKGIPYSKRALTENKNVIYLEATLDNKIYFRNTDFSTIDDFKAFIKSKYDEQNPVIIYYKLNIPYNLELTTQQKSEINKLNDIELSSITNISSNSIALLSITYYSNNDVEFKTIFTDRIIGYVDKLDAIKQAIYHILSIERYAYLIYSNNYGVELEQYIGKDINYLQATIEQTLKEALTYDLRIKDVIVNEIKQININTVLINFTAITLYGNLILEVNVNV